MKVKFDVVHEMESVIKGLLFLHLVKAPGELYTVQYKPKARSKHGDTGSSDVATGESARPAKVVGETGQEIETSSSHSDSALERVSSLVGVAVVKVK